MEKILIADLSTQKVAYKNYDVREYGHYGRGLAVDLIKNIVPSDAERYSSKNAVAFVPGLFTGCKVASSCRLMIVTKKDQNSGIQLSNITGNFPQKMASLSIAALVVKGIAEEKNTILHISNEGIEFLNIQELEGKNTSYMMKKLKEKFGHNAGIIAVGKTADMQMSLSTFICTYPDGDPEYYCPRSGFGDVMGSKGLRAIVVTGKKSLDRPCYDVDNFLSTGKELAKLIMNNDICGGALPAHGSITLIRLLKDKEQVLSDIREGTDVKLKPKKQFPLDNKGKKVNVCCAPMCVVGCLNRHSMIDGEVYSSPDESEVREALKISFGIDDYEYARILREKAYELGIVGTEFVTAAKVYFEATKLSWNKDEILKLLDEIEKGSIVGRLVASRTYGIARLYPDKENLFQLLDKQAIEDENKFEICLNKFSEELDEISNIDLLYAQIFILENLGFCIFTSFATVNNEEAMKLMAKLFKYRTNIDVTPVDLINYAKECIEIELDYQAKSASGNIQKNIPPFTKVLYRYFSI